MGLGNTVNKLATQEKALLEDRARFLENLNRDSKEQVTKLRHDLHEKDRENDKLILDLKQSKIHLALLEEQTAQRELSLRNQIGSLKTGG
jgi:uncharacterized protein YPO0396